MEELDYKFRMVKSWSDLHLLVKYCKQTGYACHDFETSGNNAMYPGAYPTLLGVSFQPGGAWILPLAHKDSKFRENRQWLAMLKYFGREVIANPAITKIGQNTKYEFTWWRKYGIPMVGRVFDTMLGKYLLDEERPHGLKEMVGRWLPKFDGYGLSGTPGPKATPEQLTAFWSNVPILELAKYCALDADLTFRLWVFFETRLIENKFYTLHRNLLMMGARVLGEAEFNGMNVDREYLTGLVDTYAIKIKDCERRLRSVPAFIRYEKQKLISVKRTMVEEVEAEIEKIKNEGGSQRTIDSREKKITAYMAGIFTTKKDRERIEPTNFGSPKQMIDLLFGDNGLGFEIVKYTIDKKTKQETDRPSTDEEVLLELQPKDKSGFIKALLELRALTKMNSTYVVGMMNKLNSNDKIHGSFLLHGTVTGRLSSRNPNLQNIPRDTTSSDIKRMFIAPPGWLMMQLDYSQAELRVLAAAAKEETMINWFHTGRDVHLASACLKWDEDYDKILKIYKDESHPEFIKWKARRKQAKTINFGIVYGQTAKKLSTSLSSDEHIVSLYEAQEFLDNFNNQFPQIAKFIGRQERYVKKHGYVYNLFGRKRRLPKVDSSNWGEKAEAIRQSVNAPIQGAASDYTLFSSVLIREHIRLGHISPELVQVGTVHDSLIFYIKPFVIHQVIPMLEQICRNPETKEWFNFEMQDVIMKVDFEVGHHWGDLQNYNPQEDYTKWVD